MKITCDSCAAKYTIADDKVRGRKVKIRCKGCGTPIVVDGQQPGSGASAAPASVPAGELRSAEAEAGAKIQGPPKGALDPGPHVEWSVNLSETDQRTLSTQQIIEGWKAGTITADAFVWRDGMGDWTAILESAALAPLLKAESPVPAPSPAASQPRRSTAQPLRSVSQPVRGTSQPNRATSQPNRATSQPAPAQQPRAQASPARVIGGRAQVGMDLFAGVETAGSDQDEIATSAPIAPQTGRDSSAEDPRLTGARNENSVLFSLDAMKAGFSGPKAESEKKAPARAGARRPNTDDPFGMAAAGMTGAGAPPPMFSLADNQALLSAPPPPPEPPPKPVEVYVPGAPAPERRAPARTGAMALGALLLVGAAGAYVTFSTRGQEERIAQAAASAAAVADRKARDEEQQKRAQSEKEAAEKATAEREKARAESEASKTASSADSSKGGAGNAGASTTSASTTSASTTSGSIAAGGPKKEAPGGPKKEEPKEEKKEETKPAPSNEQPFSKSSAVSALGAAAGQAGSCKKLGGPTGSGKVTVTFATSGRVTSANVSGPPFAGTSVGGCVASIFRKAKVPPFSGSAVTVAKGFAIN